MEHLRRDFQAMIDRDDGGSATGQALLKLSDGLFWGWHRVGDGELSWGVSCVSSRTAASCRHLVSGQEHLWRFLAGDGVEPTNNLAERALRYGVLWRKSSGGTASVWKSRFVSRLLSVVATCRQQGRQVLEFLTTCFENDLHARRLPSLQPRAAPVGCSQNAINSTAWAQKPRERLL